MEIHLRELTLEDSQQIVDWRNQDFVLKNFIDKTKITVESHTQYFQSRILTGKVKQFIIVCDGRDVGTTFLRDIDYQKSEAEFGIFIGNQNYLGKGIGTAAAHLITKYGFNELKLNKIFLRVLRENIRAQKSYEKAGFVIDSRNIYTVNEGVDEIFMCMEK